MKFATTKEVIEYLTTGDSAFYSRSPVAIEIATHIMSLQGLMTLKVAELKAAKETIEKLSGDLGAGR